MLGSEGKGLTEHLPQLPTDSTKRPSLAPMLSIGKSVTLDVISPDLISLPSSAGGSLDTQDIDQQSGGQPAAHQCNVPFLCCFQGRRHTERLRFCISQSFSAFDFVFIFIFSTIQRTRTDSWSSSGCPDGVDGEKIIVSPLLVAEPGLFDPSLLSQGRGPKGRSLAPLAAR